MLKRYNTIFTQFKMTAYLVQDYQQVYAQSIYHQCLWIFDDEDLQPQYPKTLGEKILEKKIKTVAVPEIPTIMDLP